IQALKNALETMKKWNSLFLKLKNYTEMDYGTDSSVKSLNDVLITVKNYSEMTKSVTDTLKNLRDEIIKVKLINEETIRYSKNQDDFYTQLNEKFAILSKVEELAAYDLDINVNT